MSGVTTLLREPHLEQTFVKRLGDDHFIIGIRLAGVRRHQWTCGFLYDRTGPLRWWRATGIRFTIRGRGLCIVA